MKLPERTLRLEQVHNLRDLGGLPAAGNRRTRHGRLFRSDCLDYASESDVSMIRRTLGVRTVVDLRAAYESPSAAWFKSDGCNYVNAPIVGDPDDSFVRNNQLGTLLARRYAEYLELSSDSIASVITTIARSIGEPAVLYHCALGKDRTGVVTAVLLSAVGVSDEVIVDDYALTQASMPRLLERLAVHPVYARFVATRPAEFYRADKVTMETFLQQLNTVHGGARNWLLRRGVEAADLDRLEGELICEVQQEEAR